MKPAPVDNTLQALAQQLDSEVAPGAAPGAAPIAPGAPGAAVAPGAVDWLTEARELWQIVALLSLRWASLEKVFTPAAIDRLARAWAPVLERHQLDMAKFGIYIAAGGATLPIAAEAWRAIQAERANERSAASVKSDAPAATGAGIPDPLQLHKRA